MPVTKCEPETTRKASRKSVKTQETALSALLAQTEEVSVPLDSLIKSPLNVRTVPYSAESVSGHCCKVSDEAAFCLIQRPYISKTLLTRRISPRGSP